MSSRYLIAAAVFAIAAGIAAPAVWSQTASTNVNTVHQDAMSASPPQAAAAAALPGTAQLWQITRQTTVAGQAPTTQTVSLCTGPDDLKSPPVPLTGPQCPNQIFSADGGTVTWTADCDAVKGSGTLTVSSDNQSLSGDITDTAGNATTHVTGVVTGTCNRS